MKGKKTKTSVWPFLCFLSPSFLQPIERNPLIYHCDLDSFHSEDDNLPDEFFEVTVDDIRKRFAQLKSERWERDMNIQG